MVATKMSPAIDTINVSKCLFAHQLRVVGPQNALSKKNKTQEDAFQETGSLASHVETSISIAPELLE